jgi:plasmid stability protein
MPELTIKLDRYLMKRLRFQSKQHGRSNEDEAREILRQELTDLGTAIRRRFARVGGIELDIPPRGPERPLPTFDD